MRRRPARVHDLVVVHVIAPGCDTTSITLHDTTPEQFEEIRRLVVAGRLDDPQVRGLLDGLREFFEVADGPDGDAALLAMLGLQVGAAGWTQADDQALHRLLRGHNQPE